MGRMDCERREEGVVLPRELHAGEGLTFGKPPTSNGHFPDQSPDGNTPFNSQLCAVHLFPHRPQVDRPGSLLPLVVREHIASDMATEPQLAAQLMSHQLFDTEKIEPAVASHADRDDGPSGSKRARERCVACGFG